MTSFTETALVKKLTELNTSQQSIQTLSLWLIHHRKHHSVIVKTWFSELLKVTDNRKLTYMYLANDVIQNSKRKGPEFGKEFGGVLKKAFENIGSTEDDKTKASLGRLIQIWAERGVYEADLIKDFKHALEQTTADEPPKKSKKRKGDTEKSPSRSRKRSKSPGLRERTKSETVEVDGMTETHVLLSPRTPAGDPPEPEELIRALLELENSASSDAAIRERIAALPPQVSEVALLGKIEDKESALRLSAQVNEAVSLLNDYNKRLVSEMEDRKKLAAMLQDFMQAQRELLAQAEQHLEEYNVKLQKINEVRQEVKSHIGNLPDLTQLPDVTGGLAPLPSAGDLFNLH